MSARWLAAGIVVSTLMLSPGASAQVTISYDHKVCTIGQPCTLDIWVNSTVPLGNMVVLLHYDNTKVTLTGVQNGGYMSTVNPGRLEYFNSAATPSPTLCSAQPTCGYVHFHGLDATNSTTSRGS